MYQFCWPFWTINFSAEFSNHYPPCIYTSDIIRTFACSKRFFELYLLRTYLGLEDILNLTGSYLHMMQSFGYLPRCGFTMNYRSQTTYLGSASCQLIATPLIVSLNRNSLCIPLKIIIIQKNLSHLGFADSYTSAF